MKKLITLVLFCPLFASSEAFPFLSEVAAPAWPAALTTTLSKGDATKFGEDFPTRSENGNSKVSVNGTCAGDIPADLDLRTCDLVVDGVLFRSEPDKEPSGELVFDAAGRAISAPGVLVDGCPCVAGDPNCAAICDSEELSCLQACSGGKASEVTFRSDQRTRPTLKLRVKRREVDDKQRLEFSMSLDRSVSAPPSLVPGAWDSANGIAFPPDGHACLDTGFHLWCGPNSAGRKLYACAAAADWRPSTSGKPAPYTALKTRGEACGSVPTPTPTPTPTPSPFPGCVSNIECLSGEYCQHPDGACGLPGKCERKPDFCFSLWDPVCGCDGRTYTNSGCAAKSGVSIASPGVCN